jgi:hypothetical protein
MKKYFLQNNNYNSDYTNEPFETIIRIILILLFLFCFTILLFGKTIKFGLYFNYIVCIVLIILFLLFYFYCL